MIGFIQPAIECVEQLEDGSYGKFVIEPLERGYGRTHAIHCAVFFSRRCWAVLSRQFVSITSTTSSQRFRVVEDMTEIILNVKAIRARLHVEGPKVVYISTEEGRSGVITAGDIVRDDEVEIINTDLPIAHLNGEVVFHRVDVVQRARLLSAERNKWSSQPIGVIPIDSIFTD